MAKRAYYFYTACTLFIQLAAVSVTSTVQAGDMTIFKAFNPNARIQGREPQNFVADADFKPAPEEYKTFIDYVFVQDKAGYLDKMARYYNKLNSNDDHVRNWDLVGTANYKMSTREERSRFFEKNFLKYIDKRISGGIKEAKKGSTMASIAETKKALSPKTEAAISPNFKLKFRAKVLKGLAIIKVDNPFIDYNTYLSISDGIRMEIKKQIKGTRTIASINYYTAGTEIDAFVEQGIIKNLKARITAKDIVSGDSSHEVRLHYSAPFNF